MTYTPADPIKSGQFDKPLLKIDLPDGVDLHILRSNSCCDLTTYIGVCFKLREENSQRETLLYLAEILESAAKQIREQNE